MRHALALIALTALTAAAEPHSSRSPSALLKQAASRLEKGDAVVARSRKIRRESKRVHALERAKPHYRQARALALVALRDRGGIHAAVRLDLERIERRATRSLVAVLDTEAEFHFGRTSTGTARKLNNESLLLLPGNGRALQLARDIRNAANSGHVVSSAG